jgi:hypothetical protein
VSGTSRRKVSTFAQRVAWLNAHRKVIDGMPLLNVFRMMREDGLFAKTTYLVDIKCEGELFAANLSFSKSRVTSHESPVTGLK